ncbi:MAG TPA: cytochrome c [Lacibacter sp.]|nr:cytochrome c [Lacibacter sp.]HMO89287.1 cytochrome c [Lacibacter sp.]HMP85776.1 cytochrome c [Lacibacter sp.]
MKKLFILLLFTGLVYACGSNDSSGTDAGNNAGKPAPATTAPDDDGIGKFKNVQVSPTLDVAKAEAGLKVYDVKCASCHKLTDERVVGPGWKGVTARHTPAWILNFATNVDEMLEKDPKAMAQLEICLVRMPNQNLTDNDAYNVLEFMRKNDGVQ